MSQLTITALGFEIQPLVDLRDGPAVLRWAYNRSFLDSNGVQVQWGTQTTGFGVEVACSIAGGLVTVDNDSDLWTTDDARDPAPSSIWISAWLLTTRGKLIQPIQIVQKTQFIVPSSQAPSTTWQDFSEYQGAVVLANPPTVFYTAAQVDRLIDGSFAEHPADQTTLGTVFTSVDPAIAGSPVAWITDDPLVRDAIKIQGVDVSDTAPLDSQALVYNQSNNQWEPSNQAAGTGNVISNEVLSVDGELTLFSGTGGKTIRRGIHLDNPSELLGRGDSGGGDPETIQLGSGLSMTGTTLTATGTGGDVTAASNLTDEAIVVGDGGLKGVQTTPVTIDPITGLMAGATVDDPTTDLEIANKEFVLNAVSAAVQQTPNISALIQGGTVFWETNYNFRVSAATYLILGDLYSSVEQTITLDPADLTLDRIDVIALDTTGTVVKITGDAAAQPSQPAVDPGTQLLLTFVFVAANTTQPTGVTNEDIYLENTEWTSSTSGAGWNPNSTNNPYSGTKDIEGTNVANGAYVQLEAPAPLTLDSYAILTAFVSPKASWPKQRSLTWQWYSAGVAVGVPVTLNTGFFGFNSATISYQLVAIPIAQFAVPAGTSLNQLRITDKGGAIGMYIDNIVLQANGGTIGNPPTPGITQDQADARYLQRANNFSDLTSVAAATAALNALVGDTGTGGTKGLAPAPAAGDAAAGKFLKADATWAAPSGTGAPADATYITQTSNGGLSAEQALASLATGLLKNTTTTGVLSIGAAGTDYVAPGSITSDGITMNTARLLGRTTASSGAVEEITVSGLTLSSGTLTATIPAIIQAACSDESTALTTGTAKVTFRMPRAMTVTDVRASLTTAQASGSIFTVDINESGTSILSTKLTIDNTELTSTTAATPPVISDANLADDAQITVDIDQVGTAGATGLKIALIGTWA